VRIGWRIAAPGATLLVVSLALFAAAGAVIPVALRAAEGLVDIGPYVEAVLG
jgi:multicomponent Na+:H+ antiporter subunit D